MFTFSRYLFLLGADSGCASAAIQIQATNRNNKWKLPVAFAVCDGTASFAGSFLKIVERVDMRIVQMGLFAAYLCAVALLIFLRKTMVGAQSARLRQMIGLLALPALLSADNLVAPRVLSLSWPPAEFAIAMALSSGMMSILGLMLADLFRENRKTAAYGAISLMLFVLAWIVA
jgi:hypothetical protein